MPDHTAVWKVHYHQLLLASSSWHHENKKKQIKMTFCLAAIYQLSHRKCVSLLICKLQACLDIRLNKAKNTTKDCSRTGTDYPQKLVNLFSFSFNKFAEMSTWQQVLNVQVQVQIQVLTPQVQVWIQVGLFQNCTQVQLEYTSKSDNCCISGYCQTNETISSRLRRGKKERKKRNMKMRHICRSYFHR